MKSRKMISLIMLSSLLVSSINPVIVRAETKLGTNLEQNNEQNNKQNISIEDSINDKEKVVTDFSEETKKSLTKTEEILQIAVKNPSKEKIIYKYFLIFI